MYKYRLLIAVIFVFAAPPLSIPTSAATTPDTTSITALQKSAFGLSNIAELLGLCDYIADNARQDCSKPLDIRDILLRIVQIALGFTSLAALIFVLYGGFTCTTAAGSEEKVKKGKNILQWPLIGLFVIGAAWSIITYVMATISQVI